MKKKQPYKHTEDLNDLAAKLAKGDAMAIAQIYEQTYTSLLYFGLQVVGKHQQPLVEGIIQDLFIWLAKNYLKVADIQNIEAYLYQSLRRNLQQKLQAAQEKRKAQKRYLKRTTPNQDATIPSIENGLIQQEQTTANKELLNDKLSELPTYLKEVLYLRFYEDRSYKEIAEILSVNAQVARNYVFRALTVLRKRMNKLPFLFF